MQLFVHTKQWSRLMKTFFRLLVIACLVAFNSGRCDKSSDRNNSSPAFSDMDAAVSCEVPSSEEIYPEINERVEEPAGFPPFQIVGHSARGLISIPRGSPCRPENGNLNFL